jgi:hypothetical protein
VYSGHVYVIGALAAGADIRNATYPLKDVVVLLLHIDGNTETVLASVMTNQLGEYQFQGWDNSENKLHVVLSTTDGFLRGGRSSSQFLTPTTVNVASPWKWGPPQAAVPSNGDFGLLINGAAKPTYNRPLAAEGFQGNSHPESYWRHQYASYNSKPEFSSAQLDAWRLLADELAGCVSTANGGGFASGQGQFPSRLRAAALNLASGRGPFEPYDEAGRIMLAIANHMCRLSLPLNDADQIEASKFVDLINAADDIEN